MTPEKNNRKLTQWLLMATIALLALVLGLQLWQIFGRTAPGNAENDPENPPAAGPLDPSASGQEAAKSAAFAHAGVSAGSASVTKCELDEDDGLWLYEIEFQVGSTEYEYEIDASTGAVLKAELDH